MQSSKSYVAGIVAQNQYTSHLQVAEHLLQEWLADKQLYTYTTVHYLCVCK